jgi:hypothetical protein
VRGAQIIVSLSHDGPTSESASRSQEDCVMGDKHGTQLRFFVTDLHDDFDDPEKRSLAAVRLNRGEGTYLSSSSKGSSREASGSKVVKWQVVFGPDASSAL